jgi:hypothetical protein
LINEYKICSGQRRGIDSRGDSTLLQRSGHEVFTQENRIARTIITKHFLDVSYMAAIKRNWLFVQLLDFFFNKPFTCYIPFSWYCTCNEFLLVCVMKLRAQVELEIPHFGNFCVRPCREDYLACQKYNTWFNKCEEGELVGVIRVD